MALYEYIVNVETTHRRKVALERDEKELTAPIIADYTKMGEIYEIFAEELLSKTDIKLGSIESRRIFIIIVTRLFCPISFTGRNLKRGIRDQMARVLGIEASVISHDFKILTFHYKRYRDFRSMVDKIYESIMDVLSEK